jgi:hypothetical protein
VRRAAVLLPIAVLAGALLAWRRRRARAVRAPLAGPASPQPVASPRPVASLPAGDRFLSVAWTLVAAPPDRAELTVRYVGGPELEPDRFDAQETPTQVFVTVLMRRAERMGDAAQGRRELEAVVALSRPLGERELVHAPVDLPAPGGEQPGDPPLYS